MMKLFSLATITITATATTNTFTRTDSSHTWFSSVQDWSSASFPHWPQEAVVSSDLSLVAEASCAARILDVAEGSILTVDEATIDLGPTICFPNTQVRVTKATAEADTVCEDSTTICTSAEWEFSPTTATAHRVCRSITACPAGTYETQGPAATTDRVCEACATGEFKAGVGQTPCLGCAPGSYQDEKGQSSCKSCDDVENSANYDCAPGLTHSGCTGATGGSCIKCDIGYEKPNHGPVKCDACGAGSYTNIAGEATCLKCAEGKYQAGTASTACVKCAEGKYGVSEGAESETECSHCPSGKFQDAAGGIACKSCTKGNFGDVSTATVTEAAHCVKCPAGKFQEADGVAKCDDCASGKYMDADGSHTCKDCQAIDGLRFWWTNGQAGQTKCAPKALHCEGDSWSNWSTCSLTCGTGYQTRTRGYKNQQPCSLLNAEDCSREWPIDDATVTAHKCGTVKISETIPCNENHCPVNCKIGAWEPWSTCTQECHKPGQDVGSHYRTRTLVEPLHGGVACPHRREVAPCHTSCCKGYEQDEVGSSAAADNIITQASVRIAHDIQVESVRSRAGHYQIKFADASSVCAARGTGWQVCSHDQVKQAFTAGMNICACGWANDASMYYPLQVASKFCGQDIGVHNCGSLTFKGALGDAFCCGQRQQPVCTQCAPGTYSSWLGLGKCVTCPVGKYQTAFGQDGCTACSKGTASSAVGATSASTCVACTHGKYTDNESASECTNCSKGTEQGTEGATHQNTCSQCAAGKYAAQAGTRACQVCEKGRFQSAEGAYSCTDCAAGTQNNNKGSDNALACLACGVGTYALAGRATCTECPAGTANGAEGAQSDTACASCSEGKYSGKGAETCTTCAVGRFMASVGATSCDACTKGTYNPSKGATSSSSCISCPKGHWCQEGAAAPNKCAAGMSLNRQGAGANVECENCATGRYHTDEGVAECIICPVGTFQDQAGKTSCQDCAAGRAQPLTEQKEATACEACHAGKYQPVAKRSFCVPCGKGFYQTNTAQTECTKCAAGQFGDARGADTVDKGCKDCVAGRYSTTEGALGCAMCEIGQFSTTVGASQAATCEHCDWGRFSNMPGQTSCLACSKGHYGETQNTRKGMLTHCLQCPKGKFQEFDGSTKCEDCAAGQFVSTKGNHECQACAKVDDLRIYWSASGADTCYKKKLDCKVTNWSTWSTCTKSCKAGVANPGTQYRTRAPADQLPCSLSSGCHEGWGVGAKLCNEWDQHEDQNCNTQQCPVNCVISQWAGWSQCSKSCGEGETTRKRSIVTPLKYGGSCSHHFSETTWCNKNSCDVKLLPKCHGEHIHCKVVQKHMQNWAHTDQWGKSATTNQCHRWWVYAYGNCHHCDTPDECALKGIHKTIVVTHDKKFANMENQRNMFHCFYSHANHPEKARFPASLAADSCYCTCKMHPPCAAQKGKELTNAPIRGNHWHNIETQQTCCNMCTNHPDCESFTYKSSKECIMYTGSPVYTNAPTAVADFVWSGCQSGDIC
jgi:hypothetical protein